MPERSTNHLALSGTLLEIQALRYTPAGVPVVELRIEHRSRQMEAGGSRDAGCEVDAVAVGPSAQQMAGSSPGARFEVRGFLAARSQRNRKLVLHVQDVEFLKED